MIPNKDIIDFFTENNLFVNAKAGLNFDKFKKIFFPQLYQATEEVDDKSDKEARELKNFVNN